MKFTATNRNRSTSYEVRRRDWNGLRRFNRTSKGVLPTEKHAHAQYVDDAAFEEKQNSTNACTNAAK